MTSRSTASRRGASKSSGPRKKNKVNIPGWVWLFTGLVLGFFIAFLMGLTPKAVDVHSAAGHNPGQAVSTGNDINKPVFDFYTLLPESEVSISSELPSESPKVSGQPKASSALESGKANKQYLLQAGSFRNEKDAERLRAQLLLEGLEPKVERVMVGAGESWYRVQLGPFSDRQSLQSTQRVLASKKIDTLLLQVK